MTGDSRTVLPGDTAARTLSHATTGEGRLYVGTALAALLTVAAGFGPSFYARPATLPPLAPLVVLHGMAFTGWILLFFAQTLLVSTRRTGAHRTLGIAGAALAVVLLVTAPPLAFAATRRGAFGPDSQAFLLVILVDLLLFGCFAGAGLLLRRRREVHRRLMLLALISLLPPAISRWPIAANRPAVIALSMVAFVAAAPLHDRLHRRLHPVSLWGGLAGLLSIPVRFAIARTDAWHRVASWLIR